MRLKVLPYKPGSRSAKSLANNLRALRIVSPNYRQRRREIILNWGSARPSQELLNAQVLNKPYQVDLAAHKDEAFETLQAAGVCIPEYTTRQDVAQGWSVAGDRVVVRKIVNGHSGRGIEIVQPGGNVPYAPLYTKYVRRDGEFRVHVFKGEVIDYARKKRRQDYESMGSAFNEYVRNYTNGWIFARENVVLPEAVRNEAVQAVAALGLDFGAVDVIYREGTSGEKAYVLEVNTAPGLEGTTLERYTQAVARYMHGFRESTVLRSNRPISNHSYSAGSRWR